MRQSPISSIISKDGGNASFMMTTIYKSCFNLGISKNNMTRINKMIGHKASQNALMKLHI